MLRSSFAVVVALAGAVAACSGSVGSSLTGACTAGTARPCLCPTGGEGAQICSAEGTFLACVCGATVGPDAGQATFDGGPFTVDGSRAAPDGGGSTPDGSHAKPDAGAPMKDATGGCIDAAACGSMCGSVVTACGTVDCGGCPSGETCNDNTCESSTCTPACSGKACGASDGCGGTCEEGTCGSGLHCVSGTCACDETSCSGCCDGSKCKAGTSSTYCGTGGAACSSCGSGSSCSDGSCAGACTEAGGACTTSTTCCSGSDCEGSVCTACGGVGAGCGPDATMGCCADGTVSCEGPNQTCCGLADTPCTSAGDCCGDQSLTCGAAGKCVSTSSTGSGITCGTALCKVGSQYCCDGRPPEFETELQCDALPTQDCTIATLECDDESDCPTGQFCCARPSQPDELVQWASTCGTTCSGGTTGDTTTAGERLCNPNAATDECASIAGKTATCQPWIGIDQAEYACDCGTADCYP